MPYHKKKQFWINAKKSLVVGIIVLILDIFQHFFFTSHPESFYYYFWKPIISGYVAFFMYKYQKKLTNLSIAAYSIIFAGLHGIYYRILDFAYGLPFWARVQDVKIGSLIFRKENFIESLIAWGLIHGLPFFIGVKIANKIIKK